MKLNNFKYLKHITLPFLLIHLIFFSLQGKINKNKPPFSVSALEYLLNRKDYVRFDWYIKRYLKQYPDTTILHILKGYRYFNHALETRTSINVRIDDKTGGIPRKYPPQFAQYFPNNYIYIKFTYDNILLKKAFLSMEKARSLEPKRQDLYTSICHMAAQTGQIELLSQEIYNTINNFGYSEVIEKLILNFFKTDDKSIPNNSKIHLLRILLQSKPDNSTIETELGKYHYIAGNIDSTFYYTHKSLKKDSLNLRTINNAITLASISGNYKAASDFAKKKFNISGTQTDLEQAVLYTFTYDSVLAYSLQCKTKNLKNYSDTLSLSKWLFTKSLESEQIGLKRYFSKELFHLNLPLFSINYKRSMDKVDYYSNKAGAFFVYAIYDSAAYYNLNLLRSLKKDNELGYAALFNLAAEYYAAGEYRLSYNRFLALYNYYDGKQDCAVRYGLGVNYETFGDYANAKKEYSYVLQNPDDFYTKKYGLLDLVNNRLKRINKN